MEGWKEGREGAPLAIRSCTPCVSRTEPFRGGGHSGEGYHSGRQQLIQGDNHSGRKACRGDHH